MTEAEWLTSTDGDSLMRFLNDRGRRRKWRLLIAAELRRYWEHLPNDLCREGVAMLEKSIDGELAPGELRAFKLRLQDCRELARAGDFKGIGYARYIADNLNRCYPRGGCPLFAIRDIFGNPFRPVAVDPRWLTSTVVGLAEGIYADRAFDRLPILADALQDAGCVDADVLGHCRGPGPHVRGCWVVDLVLGKQ